MRFSVFVLWLMISACSSSEIGANKKESIVSSRIEEKRDAFKLCFENARLPVKEAEKFRGGLIRLEWTIEADGWVKKEPKLLQDSVKVPAITRCISKTVQSIQFEAPRAGGTIQVSYPFKYTIE